MKRNTQPISLMLLAGLLILGLTGCGANRAAQTDSGASAPQTATSDKKETETKAGKEQTGLRPIVEAPAFQAKTVTGKKIALSDYRGKKAVLLNFYANF